MTLQVIGAGFGRTGTLSLKLALEELGLGPCYYMLEVNAHAEHDALWLAIAKGESKDWRTILRSYRSTVDWPTTYLWKELLAANRGAKVILTVRDPDAWYASAAATIFARMLEFRSLCAGSLRGSPGPETLDPVRRRHMEMIDALIVERTFGGSLDKDHAIRVFNAHNDEVRRIVPPDQLLIYESGQGWDPLCAFLDVPVPATPYPKINTTDDFTSRFPDKR